MARRRKKRAVARRHNAGTRRRRHVSHRRHHRNPAGIGSPKQWLFGGAGALAGFVGSAAIPQMVLGASNTGVTGYVGTAAATIGLALLSAFLLPRQQAVTFGVAAGGFANLLRRIITDQTPFGSYLSTQGGMGDYMVSNWGPPLMTNGLQSALAAPYGTAVAASSGVSMGDMADIGGGYHRPC